MGIDMLVINLKISLYSVNKLHWLRDPLLPLFSVLLWGSTRLQSIVNIAK